MHPAAQFVALGKMSWNKSISIPLRVASAQPGPHHALLCPCAEPGEKGCKDRWQPLSGDVPLWGLVFVCCPAGYRIKHQILICLKPYLPAQLIIQSLVLLFAIQKYESMVLFSWQRDNISWRQGCVFSAARKKNSSLQMNYKWQLVQFSQGLNIIELGWRQSTDEDKRSN